MIIRKAAEEEYEAVRGFYHSLIDAWAMSGSPVYVGWKKDIYPAPEFLADSIRKGELYVVLEEETMVAAMVVNQEYNESYSKIQWKTAAEDAEMMSIHALGVHPDFAGRGYAYAMVQAAIRLAEQSGMKVIRLDVIEGNQPAVDLYTVFGFEYIDTVTMYYEDTGWKDFMLYEYVV
ncbi:MAG: GNAT family N-acetyltransferase [Firmicutes bacterium]|nr:GNAT family N-acetyltransferase [Bacillota bacterium]